MAEFNQEFEDIRVTEHGQREEGWTFFVEIGTGDGLVEYFVDLDRDYWTKLTDRRVEPAELIRLTFKFLLEREQKEIILKKFNMADITGYFPQYEYEVKKML